jgi:hypothetical protein
MLHQPGIRRGPNSPKQDEIKIILVGADFEVIARLDLATIPYCFWYYYLSALSHIGRH